MEILVTIHSVWRYVVLVTAIGALALAAMAFLGSRQWDPLTDRLSLFFTIAMDVQVVVGLLVWITAAADVRNDTFLNVVHPIVMIVAVGLAHVGRVRSDRAAGSRDKGRMATLFFGGSLLLILLAIPLASWPI